MRTKVFATTIASFLALVFLMSAVSAATIFSDNFDDGDLSGWTVDNWTNPGTYAKATNIDVSELSRTISTADYESISVSYDRQLGDDWETTDSFKVSYTTDGSTYTILEEVIGSLSDALPNDSDFVSKSYNLNADADDNTNFEIKIECSASASDEFCNLDNILIEGVAISTPAEEFDFCAWDEGITTNPGDDLVISIEDISVIRGFGDDEEWLILDEIEVELEIENKGDNDIDDIEIEWALYDTGSGTTTATAEFAVEPDEIDEIDVKDDDEETLTFKFKIDESDLDVDLDELDSSYLLVVRATGEVDDEFDSMACAQDSEEISIEMEENFVILTDIEVPETASCGRPITIQADVWNIGDEDQDEVLVKISNEELGIEEFIEFEEIEAFEKEKLIATITLPDEADEKSYLLKMEVFDEDEDIYENDDESRFTTGLNLQGNCGAVPEQPNVLVSASLVSGGNAGEKLVVESAISNIGNEPIFFTISTEDVEDWAVVDSITPGFVNIGAGEIKTVEITLNVNEDISGDQSFEVVLTSEEGQEYKQPIQVSIKESGTGFTNPFGDGNMAVTILLILIGILVIAILITLIIRAVK